MKTAAVTAWAVLLTIFDFGSQLVLCHYCLRVLCVSGWQGKADDADAPAKAKDEGGITPCSGNTIGTCKIR